MSELITEPLPPQRPHERHAQLETDLFCEHCGYNLHGQGVIRDERLGIMVCRCPECGRFHPAAYRTTAPSLWLGRLASGLLLLWILIILAAFFFAGLGFGALQMIHIDMFTDRKMIATDGRELEWSRVGNATRIVYAGTTQPAGIYKQLRVPRAPRPINPNEPIYYNRGTRNDLILLTLFSAAIGLPGGVFVAVLFWHWRPQNYVWMALVPFISAAFVVGILFFEEDYELIRFWGTQRALFWASIQALFVGAGILVGRPFARLLVRMFIPPRPRQYLAFLWKADGKVPPGVAA